MGQYRLTDIQVDLILHCLEYTRNLTIEEDNERRKIVESLQDGILLPPLLNTKEDPYANYCDI
jgi:hypothetical protein